MAGITIIMAELPKIRQRSVYLFNVNYLSSFNYDRLYCAQWRVKIMADINMADLPINRQIYPAIIIRTKVVVKTRMH